MIKKESSGGGVTLMSSPTKVSPKMTNNQMIVRIMRSDTVRNFWFWGEFKPYAKFIAIFSLLMLCLTFLFGDLTVYQNAIGFLSAAIEATLGVPQFLLNYKRKNTSGLRYVF